MIAAHFETQVRSNGEVTTVALCGELDLATVGRLHRSMADARSLRSSEMVIDASRLTFVDGCGLRALTAEVQAARCGRRRVRTINLSGIAARVARLLDLEAALGAPRPRSAAHIPVHARAPTAP